MELSLLIGVSKEDIEIFKIKLNTISELIVSRKISKSGCQSELDSLKKNRISALPDFFYTTHIKLQEKLNQWKIASRVIEYSVKKGDSLWSIAGKMEIYCNPYAWPVILRANSNQIKFPDLILTGQKLKIPALSDEQIQFNLGGLDLSDEQIDKYENIRHNHEQKNIDDLKIHKTV